MNIHIERKSDSTEGKIFVASFVRVLTHQFGLLAVVLFVILAVTDAYYQNVIHHDGTLYFVGFGSFTGFALLLGAVFSSSSEYRRYVRLVAQKAGGRSYLTLTDEFIEEGIPGLWQRRCDWSMLTNYKEHTARFDLNFGEASITIYKNELKDANDAAVIRAFLNSKCSKGI